jgi:flagellar protein FliO/FliZ
MRLRALVLLAAFALATSLRAADDKALGYFSDKATATNPVPASSGYGATTLVGVILLGGAGGWLYMRGRKIQISGRVVRRLVIDETKSLGSRQYLVVASYEGKKFMLGVCPGRIDLLTPLDGAPSQGKAP